MRNLRLTTAEIRPGALLLSALLACAALAANGDASASLRCAPPRGVALQVLGSGGPIADDGRASSAYLLWVDGKARVMVDAGGGSFLRFGESGAKFEDLDLVALSHYHTDHSAGLPALLKSGYFSERDRSLMLSGPDGNRRFPGLEGFLDGMLGPENGAYRYLSGYRDGSDGLVMLDTVELPHRDGSELAVMRRDGLKVTALPVPHGIVPTISYRVEVGNRVIVFGSDQNGTAETFTGFAAGADVLVAHMAIPENAGAAARRLHATPSAIGAMAAGAGARKLVLSHFMARSLRRMEGNLGKIRERYNGEIIAASDGVCVAP